MSFDYFQTIKLGDVADILSGYAFKTKDFKEEGIPVVKIKNIIPPNIDISDVQYVSEELYSEKIKYALNYNDVLISMTGSNINQIASAVGKIGRNKHKNKKLLLNQRVGKLILADETKCNYDYLYYYLTQEKVRYSLAASAGGSANQANISPKQIKNIDVNIPPLEDQKAIANILSSLDEKIEVNNQINKKLEEMAEAIFNQWFVDFEFPNEEGKPYKSSGGAMVESELGMIPEGWEVKTLDDITSKFATGLNPRKNFVLGQGENFYVTIKNMNNGKVILDKRCDKVDDDALKKINKRSDLQKGDLLFSGIGTIGRVYLIDETPVNWNISESIFTLRGISSISSEFLYLHLLSPFLQGYANQLASGSVQKGIRMADLKKYKLVLPTKNIHEEFTQLTRSIITRIKSNDNENIKLTSTRDILLPKLMSGEIRVPIEKE